MKLLLANLLAFGFCFSLNANAISIDLLTDNTNLHMGDTVEVQVKISGLTDTSAPSLGDYDVNFHYDESLFSIANIYFGDAVKGNQLDLMGFGSLQDTNSGSGWLSVFELSFDDALDLTLYQASEFTLFSVILNAVAIGNGNFSLTANALGDAYGNELSIDTINGTAVNIGSVSVPEPSSLLLLLGALAALCLRAKSSK
jgi:hypothetical protein